MRRATKPKPLQNTSDEDAGYGGPKGPGHQAQIAQAAPPVDTEGEQEGPGLLTAMLPESAANSDSHATEPVLEKQAAHGLLPEELACDTAYGSDSNVYSAQQTHGVKIISPVSGAPQDPGPLPEPEDKSESTVSASHRPSSCLRGLWQDAA